MTISINAGIGVAAPTFSALVTLIAKYLNRTDLNDQIPAFIELAERRFNRVLPVQAREVDEVVTITDDLVLPDDFHQLQNAYIDTDPKRVLEQVTPSELQARWAWQASGCPQAFAIQSGTMKFAPAPDGPYTLRYSYIRKIELLGQEVPANWLLDKHPDIYLYGALVQAEAFLNNDPRVALWKGALDEALGELVDDSNRYRSSAPIRMRPSTYA